MFEDLTTSNKVVKIVNTQGNPVMANKFGLMVSGFGLALVSEDDPVSKACLDSRTFISFDEVEFMSAAQEERLAESEPKIQLMSFSEWMSSKTSKKKPAQPSETPQVSDQQNNDPQP
jgi:hypothetical protein